MITPKESALVLAKINAHHGNAQITQLQAQCFHEELRPYVTLQLAMDAVREFYASNETGRWMGSGDVNAYVKRALDAKLPSDADIAGMAAKAGLTASCDVWQFRRSLLKACGAGIPLEQARAIAVRQAATPIIGPASSALRPVKALPKADPSEDAHGR